MASVTVNGGIVADHGTISTMISAFDECQGECGSIASAVSAARGNLISQWHSDEAAPRFMQAVDQWMDGFQKVRQGLDMLNGNMQTYRGLTDTTEQGGAAQAGGWATP
ncbi:WXG100 family type VII secretion target [Dactylosporangium sp. CA-092794]|uniref:WXG100 family type VII secretion target n=1 Tax=Dactylosporangium sp. CA-092794 TaxID=3239929 RepID=UPI003D8F9208